MLGNNITISRKKIGIPIENPENIEVIANVLGQVNEQLARNHRQHRRLILVLIIIVSAVFLLIAVSLLINWMPR